MVSGLKIMQKQASTVSATAEHLDNKQNWNKLCRKLYRNELLWFLLHEHRIDFAHRMSSSPIGLSYKCIWIHTYVHTYIRAKNYGPWMELALALAIARGALVPRDKELSTRGPPLEALNLAVSLALVHKRYISMGMAGSVRGMHYVFMTWNRIGRFFSLRLSLLILLVFALRNWLPFALFIYCIPFFLSSLLFFRGVELQTEQNANLKTETWRRTDDDLKQLW